MSTHYGTGIVETVKCYEALADRTELDMVEAEKVVRLMKRRASNRGDENGQTALVVAFEDWAFEDWSDYEISNGPVLLSGRVDDHSKKSFRLEGAYQFDFDRIDTTPIDQMDAYTMPDWLSRVDDTDEDWADVKGVTYVPKSAVSGVYDYVG